MSRFDRPTGGLQRIAALAAKDFSLFFRNRFIALVTVLGIVFYLLVYFLMPRTVDETLRIGVYAPALPMTMPQGSDKGIALTVFGSEEELKGGVIAGRFTAGFALRLEERRIIVYFPSDAPDELRDSISILAGEFALSLAGQPLPVDVNEEVIGEDMAGMQIPPRDRLRPLVAIFILLLETLGLANLISEEVESRTIVALQVTPVTTLELYVSKGIVGFSLAFAQAVLYLAIVGGLGARPLLILVTLTLGAVLVTGVGFLIASVGRDFLSVMSWGILALVVMVFPSFTVLFPGMLTDWVKVIPSYYLVDTMHRVAGFGAGWGDVWRNLLVLLGFDAAIGAAGILALKRKMA
jgi:ABC-2 type transport system permease protein